MESTTRKGNNLAPSPKLRHTFAVSYLRNGGGAFTLRYPLGRAALQSEKEVVSFEEFSPESPLKIQSGAILLATRATP